ncbi:tRNA (guanine-N1)-methyltransferase [Metallosphaera tengchongensis]|uniref:tRNA (Guanine-N1)-methyltransferase n=2 Tax=Metallosphaera tengchongensis TaxID=1532350 RepID=A0A6N0P0L1_9CREN|nr:tRNA (guanine-N1)-methyltransferase [Metallosphaera tengchongensis]
MDIDTIYVRGVDKPILQHLALKILLYGWGLKEGPHYGKTVGEEFGITILTGRGDSLATHSFSKDGKRITLKYPETPLFIIDLSLWDRHSQDEKRKLVSQISISLSTLRTYLWDYNLSINHSNKEFEEMFAKMGFSNRSRRDVEPPKSTVVLDPYAEANASESLIRSVDCFILGGIVDDSGWKYATTKLTELVGYDFPRVKITLRGSRVGVPDRLNKIISIVMRVRNGMSLEESIIEEQSSADKFLRLLRETTINKDLEGNASWLKASERVKERVRKTLSQTLPESSSSLQSNS